MTAVYLVNVGANTAHSAHVKSPLLVDSDESAFVYVPFFANDEQEHVCDYSDECVPFLNRARNSEGLHRAHADPDWNNLTYGDCCQNLRARALLDVTVGDILLFWGLLHHNRGGTWDEFTGIKSWHLFGCLRIERYITAADDIRDLEVEVRRRVQKNIHFDGTSQLRGHDRVFVGEEARSALFRRAVDLGVDDEDAGLIYKVFFSAKGFRLRRRKSPIWSSSLRCCRKVLDLNNDADRERGKILADEVKRQSGFDLFGSSGV